MSKQNPGKTYHSGALSKEEAKNGRTYERSRHLAASFKFDNVSSEYRIFDTGCKQKCTPF